MASRLARSTPSSSTTHASITRPRHLRKHVAIVAADVEGYPSWVLMRKHSGTLSDHCAITDALIAQHRGRICGTAGDSVLAEFGSVFAAVRCSVKIQGNLAQANQTLAEERRMWFRIGINVGDVMMKDGDIFGDGVNIAARLEKLAEPGGICISRGVHDHVKRKRGRSCNVPAPPLDQYVPLCHAAAVMMPANVAKKMPQRQVGR
jgi:adenylate cyclase